MRAGLFWLNDRQWVSNRICRRDRIGTTTGASSAASFTCCNRVHDGAIVRENTALTRRSKSASIAGPSEDDGAQSSKRWPSLAKTASCCRSTRLRLKLTGVPPAEKRGAQSSNRPLAGSPHDKNPSAERSALPAGRPASDSRPGCRYRCGAPMSWRLCHL